jgi:two-component system chemotaxis sensor kinase CheA
MDDLISEFIAECREMLEALGGEIVAWEASPDDRARLDSIFRFVHTVKGNCGFFDFPRLEALSHAAEDALAEVRAGRRQADGPLVSAVLAIIDRIAEMIAALDAGEDISTGDDSLLIQALEQGAETPAAPVAATVAEAQSKAVAPRTIRLSVELLDRLMSGVSDMVLARNELARRLREARSSASPRSLPRCATRSPALECSGSRTYSWLCRAWSATFRRSSASRCWSTSKAATSSSIAR